MDSETKSKQIKIDPKTVIDLKDLKSDSKPEICLKKSSYLHTYLGLLKKHKYIDNEIYDQVYNEITAYKEHKGYLHFNFISVNKINNPIFTECLKSAGCTYKEETAMVLNPGHEQPFALTLYAIYFI